MSRDRTVGETFYIMFTTRAFADGAPTTLGGTPVVSAYEDNSVTQITAGITLGVDHDSVTGLNLLTIVATGGNGYEAGKDYHMVITTGSVDSVSVVGEVVGEFSLGLSAAFTRLGAPAGASVSADLLVIDNFVDGIETAVITNAAGADIAADIIAVKADTAATLVDSNELQTDWVNGGRLDLLLDAIKLITDAITTTGTGLTAIPWNASWDAEVESEVNDALDTAIAELGVAAPTATPTLRTGLMLMYMALRNKLVVQTSGTDALEVYNNAGTKIAAKTLTDDGADYTEAEMA